MSKQTRKVIDLSEEVLETDELTIIFSRNAFSLYIDVVEIYQ
jgi:hypothetical protein